MIIDDCYDFRLIPSICTLTSSKVIYQLWWFVVSSTCLHYHKKSALIHMVEHCNFDDNGDWWDIAADHLLLWWNVGNTSFGLCCVDAYTFSFDEIMFAYPSRLSCIPEQTDLHTRTDWLAYLNRLICIPDQTDSPTGTDWFPYWLAYLNRLTRITEKIDLMVYTWKWIFLTALSAW